MERIGAQAGGRRWPARALTGLAAGALLTGIVLGVFALGARAGLPSVAFSVFEWFTRVLPGRLVIFGLETTLRVLETLGLNIKNTAKTVEEVLAVTGLFAGGAVLGAVFFGLVRTPDKVLARRYGLALGGALGVFSAIVTLVEAPPATLSTNVGTVIWVLGVFLVWGWALGSLYLMERGVTGAAAAEPGAAALEPQATAAAAPAAAAVERINRRRFVVRMGGLVATIIVLGAELDEVLRAQQAKPPELVRAPIPFPNANSPVKPVPGTRPEYTAPADHYRVDIDLTPPSIDGSTWQLSIGGLVAHPMKLGLAQLKSAYKPIDQFITLECVSNPVGGPLIGTTLWTGPSFRDVLADAAPQPQAQWAHVVSDDGYDEVIDLSMIENDPRIVLAYNWNGQPLPQAHGYPLRVYVPDRYGMKQPKWITDIVLVADFIPGYWVKRGWDRAAIRRTTSVVDTVATNDVISRGGKMYVPVGGIADAGDRGISKVEVQVDGGPWEPAELRAPLSQLTWVIWRYEWPFNAGEHVFGVRAYDGQGRLQVTESNPAYPSGATGIDTMQASIVP
jgi:DMSO/TMAO reductase YedYZ molybdopterin-dependent catalytic subunit